MHPAIRVLMQSVTAWDGTLYELGNEFTDITGGFAVQKGAVKNAGNISIAATNPLWQGGGINGYTTENAVNVTAYTNLKVLYTSNTASGVIVGISTNKDYSPVDTAWVASAVGTDITTTLNISSYNSSYYICGYASDAGNNITIKKIWLE